MPNYVFRALEIGGLYGSGLEEASSHSLRRVISASGHTDNGKPVRYPSGMDGTVTFRVERSRRASEVGQIRTIKFSSFLDWAKSKHEGRKNAK